MRDADLVLERLRDAVQIDPGGRGLATDPADNLFTRTAGDFAAACRAIADHPAPVLGIVTGFTIPTATPIAAETDGPLGAVFLARALLPLGIRVLVAAERNALDAVEIGFVASGGDADGLILVDLPLDDSPSPHLVSEASEPLTLVEPPRPVTHLIALERPGPGLGYNYLEILRMREEDPETFAHILANNPNPITQPASPCTMRGVDVSPWTWPAERLFQRTNVPTIGIGDGGNEIGMGKIPYPVIARNVPNGERVACRVKCDHLIVAGVSNWGAYALAAGVLFLRGVRPPADLFDPEREREILAQMVEHGPLVDGVLGRPSVTVDGLPWDVYARRLVELRTILEDVT